MTAMLDVANYEVKPQAEVEAVTGREPLAMSRVVTYGTGAYSVQQANNVLLAVAGILNGGQLPVLWVGPQVSMLDAGVTESFVASLPQHPAFLQVVEMLKSLGAPCVVRLYWECNDRRPDKLLRYLTPALWRAAFVASCLKLPAGTVVAMSIGPNGFPTNWDEWFPTDAQRAQIAEAGVLLVADTSLYGRTPIDGASSTWKQLDGFVKGAKARGLYLVSGECGFMAKDYVTLPAGKTVDDVMLEDAKKLLAWCVEKDYRMLAGPFSSVNYGMVPWVGKPQVEKYLTKAFGSPLAFVQPKDPLALAGIVGAGAVTAID